MPSGNVVIGELVEPRSDFERLLVKIGVEMRRTETGEISIFISIILCHLYDFLYLYVCLCACDCAYGIYTYAAREKDYPFSFHLCNG